MIWKIDNKAGVRESCQESYREEEEEEEEEVEEISAGIQGPLRQ